MDPSTIDPSAFDAVHFLNYLPDGNALQYEHMQYAEAPEESQTVPSTFMGPPTKTRKRKAPTLRAKDWEPYKSRIIELHIEEGLPLPKVKDMIQEEFGFVAE